MELSKALNAIDNCRTAAYFAKNKKFSELWTDIADRLEVRYIITQPWLRTYDGVIE